MADIEHLEAALSPIVTDHGMELVDLEFRPERSGWVLRLYVDQQGGVTVSDCARVSRDCSVVLDAKELIERSYRLEVSSPGIERRLRKRAHFEQQVGRQVRIVLNGALAGRRKVAGTLTEVREDAVTVELQEGETLAVPFDRIKKANLKVF